MFSGNNDSAESSSYTQWPMLNPALFQNTPNEQVDWAALAQQWIQMKEAGPPIPPSSTIINSEVKKKVEDVEGYWKSSQNYDNWGSSTWNSAAHKTTSAPPTKNENPGYSSRPQTDFSGNFSGGSSRHYNKPHNKRYSKVNVPKTPPANIVQSTPLIPPETDLNTNNLDANKRKQLPAWIREGLEKMERDKLKQIEREKEKEQLSIYTEKIKEKEKETMEILKSTMKERQKSKFDEEYEAETAEIVQKEPDKIETQNLSHEELMLLVRRTMTEILLKVTNTAIQQICSEERQRFLQKKSKNSQNVTTKLGLGMYASDSGSDDSSSENSQRRNSEDELRVIIRKKKADFIETERRIENKLQNAKKEKVESNLGGTPEVQQQNKLVAKKYRRESSSNSTSNSSSTNNSSSEYNRRRRRKSSSSSSSSSSKRYTPEKIVKKRNKSRSRSKSVERSLSKRSKNRSRSRSSSRRSRSKNNNNRRSNSRNSRHRRSNSYSRRRSRSRNRSKSRSSSYRSSRRSSERSRKHGRSRSPYYSRKNSRRSRSRSRLR